MRRRCRLGLHKWARFKIHESAAGAWEPGPAGTGWETRCRYCHKKKRFLLGGYTGGV